MIRAFYIYIYSARVGKFARGPPQKMCVFLLLFLSSFLIGSITESKFFFFSSNFTTSIDDSSCFLSSSFVFFYPSSLSSSSSSVLLLLLLLSHVFSSSKYKTSPLSPLPLINRSRASKIFSSSSFLLSKVAFIDTYAMFNTNKPTNIPYAACFDGGLPPFLRT